MEKEKIIKILDGVLVKLFPSNEQTVENNLVDAVAKEIAVSCGIDVSDLSLAQIKEAQAAVADYKKMRVFRGEREKDAKECAKAGMKYEKAAEFSTIGQDRDFTEAKNNAKIKRNNEQEISNS
jgi:hypothetical protein